MSPNRPVTGSLVLLDAILLYSINICDFVLTASSHQLLARPIVTADIFDEASRNIRADRPDLDPARLEYHFNAVRAATDGHDQPVGLEAAGWPSAIAQTVGQLLTTP